MEYAIIATEGLPLYSDESRLAILKIEDVCPEGKETYFLLKDGPSHN